MLGGGPFEESIVHVARRVPIVVVVGALLLAACASDPTTETTASPSPTPTPTTATAGPTAPTTSPTAASPTTPTADATDAAGVPALASTCELDAGATAARQVTFAFPDGWQVADGNCEVFDPSLDQVPADGEAPAAVTVRVRAEDFAAAERTEDIEGEIRHVGARSGYQAVRIQGGSAGQAMEADAEPVHVWLVDLDAGADEQGGTLAMTARPSDGAGFAQAAQALDRMAQTVQVTPHAVEDGPVVVTRVEGGGTPWTVTHDLDAGCFRLRPGGPTDAPADEACGLDPAGDGIAGAVLEHGDQQVVAGFAPPRAVLVSSDAAAAPYGAVTTPIEGASLFAYEAARTPIEVRAVDAAGEALATTTVG